MILGTRHDVPEPLRTAKREAVEQFMSVTRRGLARMVHRITAHPHRNVVGVGIGRKIVKGTATARPCVRLYVARKLDRKLVPASSLLPPEIGGAETDVIEVGPLRAQSRIPMSRKRRRPALPGCSIGFRLAAPHDDLLMAGTLAAVVAQGDRRFILSNNHVLAAENELAIGTAIYQPGLLDHGDPNADAIAQLSHFVPLTPAPTPNRVDCAIAEITDAGLVAARVLPRIGRLTSAEPIAAVEGMSVEKVGRGTGYTMGKVFDVSAHLTLQYDLGELEFIDQMLIRGASAPFSAYGDSGALVVNAESGRATGLLIGGHGEFSVANHLEDVLTLLDAALVV